MTTIPTTKSAGAGVAAGDDRWITPAGAAAIALVSAAFVALFFRWFRVQHVWSSQHVEDWGHAYVIPLISAYMIYLHREELGKLRPTVFWPGLAPLMLGVMTYFNWSVGTLGNHMIQGFGLIAAIFGAALMLLGPQYMRRLFLPIAYLVFAITVSQRIMIELTFQLKLLASQGSGMVLSVLGMLFGFGCEVKGNIITLMTPSGEIKPMNVAEACSGMRMVIAFFALAGAVALLTCKEWWQRVLLVLLAAPVALLMNVVRVVVLGLLSLGDSDLATGDAHTLIGTFLLLPALGLFMGVVWALNKSVAPAEVKR